jgi:predicted O-methyltransferase YrrM
MWATAPFVSEKQYNHATARSCILYRAYLTHILTLHQVFSIESDPANAAIAKKMVEIAGLSSVVTIIEGKVCDVIPKLKSEHYVTHVDFCFVDHWKDCYLSDVQLLEGSELLRPGSRVVADNILYPGNFARTNNAVLRWLVSNVFSSRRSP